MQGGVFGSLECSLQVDLLGKDYVETGEHIFKYKNCLNIQPLGFVDDVAGASKCGQDSLIMNVKTEEFMKTKKLSLNEDKCFVMHVGKDKNCPNLTINGKAVKHVETEKYLGQYLSSNGKNDKIIDNTCNKGIGTSSQVHALLKEISLGQYYVYIGLLLRDTNVISAMLFSAESWYGVTKNQIEKIEDVDVCFLKKLFKAHSKTAKESYYLETGKIPPRLVRTDNSGTKNLFKVSHH